MSALLDNESSASILDDIEFDPFDEKQEYRLEPKYWFKQEIRPKTFTRYNFTPPKRGVVFYVADEGTIDEGVGCPIVKIEGATLSVSNPDLERLISPENEIRWTQFMDNLKHSTCLPLTVVEGVESVRNQLHKFLGVVIDPPNVSPGEEGGLELSWVHDAMKMEIEVLPDGTLEWFYKYLDTKEFNGGEGLFTDGFPPDEMINFLEDWKIKLSYYTSSI